MGMIDLEICLDDAGSLHAVQVPEVSRIELCAALSVGGLTPSAGLMRQAADSSVPVYAMIRPRAGDFVFAPDEEAIMLADIAVARESGLAGVVLGASRADGTLDEAMLARLSDACGSLGRTLHRAFDLVPDPLASMEVAIRLGFERILTSGGAPAASDGAGTLRALVQASAGRIDIMAGSGVRPENVAALLHETGVRAVHASCRGRPTRYAETVGALGFGATRAAADPDVIRAFRAALRPFD